MKTKKRLSSKKTEQIGIRITPKEKERLEQLTRLKGVTISELLRDAVDKLTEPEKGRNSIWEFIERAAEIIDREQNKMREGIHDESIQKWYE